MSSIDTEGRNAAIKNIAQFFDFEHLTGHHRTMAEMCATLAEDVLAELDDCPELTVGLRKLLEAKDCFVRASIDNQRKRDQGIFER